MSKDAPSKKSVTPVIPDKVYFRIGDVSDIVGVKPYVLRYWESEFSFVAPEKSNTGQRVYRRSDVEKLLLIKHLLYSERYSIEGAQKRMSELRRDGQLAEYQQDKVFGGGETEKRNIRRQKMVELSETLVQLAQRSVQDFFPKGI